MGRVVDRIKIDAPPEKVFSLISNLKRYPEFMPEVTEVTALDTKKSRWRAEALGVPLYWFSEFIVWNENAEISWKSYEGVKNSGTWRLAKTDNGGTELTFILEYEAPRSLGFLGALLDQRFIARELEKRISQSLNRVKYLSERT